MSSEHLYHYWKEQPAYSPSKFAIVDGFSDDHVLRKIGGYYGAGEYAVTDEDLNAITAEPDNILVFGGNEKFQMKSKSASTVDDRLMALFGNLDRGLVKPMVPRKEKKPKHKKQLKSLKKAPKRGRYESVTRKEGEPAPRMCDVTDEILYQCPDLNDNTSDNSTTDNDTESESQETSADDTVENTYDNIADPSDEEAAAMQATLMSGAGEFKDNLGNIDDQNDTDITKYLL